MNQLNHRDGTVFGRQKSWAWKKRKGEARRGCFDGQRFVLMISGTCSPSRKKPWMPWKLVSISNFEHIFFSDGLVKFNHLKRFLRIQTPMCSWHVLPGWHACLEPCLCLYGVQNLRVFRRCKKLDPVILHLAANHSAKWPTFTVNFWGFLIFSRKNKV